MCRISTNPFEVFFHKMQRTLQINYKNTYRLLHILLCKKGMYGLKQAAILAYKLLDKCLKANGYTQTPSTNGLLKHQTRKAVFALCIDNFGVKCHNEHTMKKSCHLTFLVESIYLQQNFFSVSLKISNLLQKL